MNEIPPQVDMSKEVRFGASGLEPAVGGLNAPAHPLGQKRLKGVPLLEGPVTRRDMIYGSDTPVEREVVGRNVLQEPQTHPWKVTINGDDTINVEEGALMYPDIAVVHIPDDGYPLTSVLTPLDYDGDENLDLDGYIYAQCTAANLTVTTDANVEGEPVNTYLIYPTDITIIESASLLTSATADATTLNVLIARVGTVSGTKQVIKQYLHDNPIVGYLFANAEPS